MRRPQQIRKKNKNLLNTSPTKIFFKDKDFQNFNFLNPEQKNILEIGFGDGGNLLINARQNLDSFYIGIEVYEMGVANVLNIAETEGIYNLKVILGDAVDVLEKNNHFSCFDEVIIFFPDLVCASMSSCFIIKPSPTLDDTIADKSELKIKTFTISV